MPVELKNHFNLDSRSPWNVFASTIASWTQCTGSKTMIYFVIDKTSDHILDLPLVVVVVVEMCIHWAQTESDTILTSIWRAYNVVGKCFEMEWVNDASNGVRRLSYKQNTAKRNWISHHFIWACHALDWFKERDLEQTNIKEKRSIVQLRHLCMCSSFHILHPNWLNADAV